jgi:hypothetical protein
MAIFNGKALPELLGVLLKQLWSMIHARTCGVRKSNEIKVSLAESEVHYRPWMLFVTTNDDEKKTRRLPQLSFGITDNMEPFQPFIDAQQVSFIPDISLILPNFGLY